MKIGRENNELVIRLPMEQDALDAVGELVGHAPNLIGVITGDEQGIYQSIDMTYKDKEQQVGGLIVQTYYSKEEFREKCNEWGIGIFECPVCGFCMKSIWGSFTFRDGRNCCFYCEPNKMNARIDFYVYG